MKLTGKISLEQNSKEKIIKHTGKRSFTFLLPMTATMLLILYQISNTPHIIIFFRNNNSWLNLKHDRASHRFTIFNINNKQTSGITIISRIISTQIHKILSFHLQSILPNTALNNKKNQRILILSIYSVKRWEEILCRTMKKTDKTLA